MHIGKFTLNNPIKVKEGKRAINKHEKTLVALDGTYKNMMKPLAMFHHLIR